MVTGDVTTQRIAIEEGAFLKGKVDIQKEAGKAGACFFSRIRWRRLCGRSDVAGARIILTWHLSLTT